MEVTIYDIHNIHDIHEISPFPLRSSATTQPSPHPGHATLPTSQASASRVSWRST